MLKSKTWLLWKPDANLEQWVHSAAYREKKCLNRNEKLKCDSHLFFWSLKMSAKYLEMSSNNFSVSVLYKPVRIRKFIIIYNFFMFLHAGILEIFFSKYMPIFTVYKILWMDSYGNEKEKNFTPFLLQRLREIRLL